MTELKTIDFKGKKYVEVKERVKCFRSSFPDWSIETEHIILNTEEAAIKAIIRDDKNIIRSTGTAFERKGDKTSFVNATSHVENCETSAVGRALGLLGIGIDGGIASIEEVKNSEKQQGKKDGALEKFKELAKNRPDLKEITEIFERLETREEKLKYYNQIKKEIANDNS